jgi:hypothetical protein|tara:strand:+ start:434 stop:697 length:264 start_codon:yes stop_codon:yes gene_type:complete
MPFAVEVNITGGSQSEPVWDPQPLKTFATQDEAVEFICTKYDRLVEKSNEPLLYSTGEQMFPEGHEYEIDAKVILDTYRVVEVPLNA